MKRTIDDIDVRGKRVLARLDLNVPLDDDGRITDDRRIRAALPTIKKLIAGGGRLILMSHLGRPDEEPEHKHKYTLAPVAKRLSELLDKNVTLLPDCVGPNVAQAVGKLREGDVCLLENLRFHPAETIKDKKTAADPKLREQKESFARQIAALGDAYVNDAFGTCHRDNASMLTVPKLMAGRPRVAGYLVQRELKFLGEALANPKRPFVCVLGGAKVSDKLGVIRSLLGKCDSILVGGAMAYTFLAADGMNVGRSLVEPDLFDTARELRKSAGDRLRLPVDSVAAAEIKLGVATIACESSIPADKMGLDIGPKTIQAFRAAILTAKTIVWNGPMGVFETPPFDAGTLAMATAIAEVTHHGAVSIVGGGDSAAAIDKLGMAERMTHISTGGGASLEFLEGKPFLPIEVLDDA
ncbi:MAG: phosphoglycerate kinase [Phycisphaerales bacterium]|nr:phosphoglycerate kinase [Phycisphaerales bacterium]